MGGLVLIEFKRVFRTGLASLRVLCAFFWVALLCGCYVQSERQLLKAGVPVSGLPEEFQLRLVQPASKGSFAEFLSSLDGSSLKYDGVGSVFNDKNEKMLIKDAFSSQKGWYILQNKKKEYFEYYLVYYKDRNLAVLTVDMEALEQWRPETSSDRQVKARLQALDNNNVETLDQIRDWFHASSRFDKEYRAIYRVEDKEKGNYAASWKLLSNKDPITGDVTDFAVLYPESTQPKSKLKIQFACTKKGLSFWVVNTGVRFRNELPNGKIPVALVELRINDRSHTALVLRHGRGGDGVHNLDGLAAAGVELVKGFSPRLREAQSASDAKKLFKAFTASSEILLRVHSAYEGAYLATFKPYEGSGDLRRHLGRCF